MSSPVASSSNSSSSTAPPTPHGSQQALPAVVAALADGRCPVCLVQFDDNARCALLICDNGHLTCSICEAELRRIQSNCPLCRINLAESSIRLPLVGRMARALQASSDSHDEQEQRIRTQSAQLQAQSAAQPAHPLGGQGGLAPAGLPQAGAQPVHPLAGQGGLAPAGLPQAGMSTAPTITGYVRPLMPYRNARTELRARTIARARLYEGSASFEHYRKGRRGSVIYLDFDENEIIVIRNAADTALLVMNIRRVASVSGSERSLVIRMEDGVEHRYDLPDESVTLAYKRFISNDIASRRG